MEKKPQPNIKKIDEYDDDTKRLVATAQAIHNQFMAEIGAKLKPSIILPGQNPDDPRQVFARGAQAIAAWKNTIRSAIQATLDGVQVDSLPVYAMLCGMILGEMCAVADFSGDAVPEDTDDYITDVFEGGFILGRVSMGAALETGKAVVDAKPDGTRTVKFGQGNALH